MNAIVLASARLNLDASGELWTPRTAIGYQFWSRYLDIYDEIFLATPAQRLDVPEPDNVKVSGERIHPLPMPDPHSPTTYVIHRRKMRSSFKQLLDAGSAVHLRLPAMLADELLNCLPPNYPYGVEVVGDPHDVLAPGAMKHPLRPFLRWWFPQRLRRQCAEACAAAYVTERALQQRYPPAPDAFTTHYSSVELDEQAYASAPRVYHAPLVQARLVLVGSLEQMYKAPDVAIDAVALCVSRGLDICLTIVGDGKHRPELEARADRMGVSRQVTFTGKLSAGQAVREQLDRADLFVLPSRQEGLPRAMIEAMARGLPCIGSAVGGIPELLPDEDLVPPGDAEALANKIAEVLSDPARMTRSAARNLEKARTYHNDVLRARRIEFYTYVKETTEAWLQQQRG